MIEVYAFAAVFAVQILATSILYPAWFIRYVRARMTRLPAERLAQLYPAVDLRSAQERFLTRYRALHTCIAVLGLLLLVGLFGYMRSPDWRKGSVVALVTGYFVVAQILPLAVVVWHGVRFDRAHKRSLPEATKRTALLQRRGLFDFISPVAVLVAVLSYFGFVALVFYIRQHPFPGFAGLINIVGVTLVYAFTAVAIYMVLYGKSRNSLQTHADRLHAISVTVKSGVYTCIAVVVYLSLNFSLALLDLQRWEPFALSIFFVFCALLASLGVISHMREPLSDATASASGPPA